jgi:ElaB/YqjD/DUF883 family membrane-anchored ribosome-binding protein
MANRKNVPVESEAAEEAFIESIKDSLDDIEKMMRDAADATGDRATELRESALRSLRRTRETLYDTQDELLARGRKAVRVTDDYVHDNPWQAITVAGVVGVLVGALIGRR